MKVSKGYKTTIVLPQTSTAFSESPTRQSHPSFRFNATKWKRQRVTLTGFRTEMVTTNSSCNNSRELHNEIIPNQGTVGVITLSFNH